LKFADFRTGQQLTAGPHLVTEAEIIGFASQWDPQWFHADALAANASHWGGVIASGWHTGSIAMRLVATHFLAGSESFASPGLEYVKWPAPVKVGDALTLHLEVLDARRSQSKPHLGLVHWRWRLVNQHGQDVLETAATSLFTLPVSTSDELPVA
jgi:acyl dehydratase